MDVYTFTYSDDYDIPDIHGWNNYIMDDFLFIIYYSWYLEWLCFALIAHRYFFAGYMQIAYEQALLLNVYGQPIPMDDGCAMRKCGSWDVQWLSNDVTIVYVLHLHMGMCYDLRMHVSNFNRTRQVSQ